MLSSLTSQLSLRHARKERKPILRRDKQLSNDFIKEFGEFLYDNVDSIQHIFGVAFAESMLELAEIISSRHSTMSWAKTVNDATEGLLNRLVPHYPDISDRLKRGKELGRELVDCSPGLERWGGSMKTYA